MKKDNDNKQTYECNHHFDVLVSAKQVKNSIEAKRGFFPANCEDEPMEAMVLNKYWHDSERDEYKIVAYLSKDFFDRYNISDSESIYQKTKVVCDDNDLVNKPPHYNKGGVECIDYIKQQLGSNYPAYLEGSAVKYLHRHKYKDANIQDLEKCVWYLNRLIEHYNNL